MPAEPLGLRVVRAAVLGRPVAHSLSPLLHRAAYGELGLDWEFDAIETGVAELAGLLASSGSEWAGFACTMPLKRVALELAESASARASAVGAANTLLPRSGGWLADNTDVAGMLAALGEAGVRPATATVLGAGGTAQAAVVALAELGLGRCSVLVRDRSRAAEVVRTAERVGIQVELGTLDDAAGDLVISTLPAGAADALAARSWRAGQALLDVVYSPWPTPLATAVASAGGTVVSGALMLLHQAARQVELMTGQPAPVAAMRTALRAAAPDAL
ncbi:MAG TPA: shikimate dehydrogenase [Jatrophihabitantaceae bacterium]